MTNFGSGLTQVFRTIGNQGMNVPQRHLPMLNEITSTLNNFFEGSSQLRKKKALMAWYKSIPELTAIANKVARDISSSYHFEPIDSKGGMNRVIKANSFALNNQYRRTKFAQVVDKLITGESYSWIGKLTSKQVEDTVKEVLNKYKYVGREEKSRIKKNLVQYFETKFNSPITDEIEPAKPLDEDALVPKKLRYMASTTMENIFDKYDIISYIQHVMGRRENFKKDEIVRGTFMDVDGKVGGFTPVESIVVQLELLRFMWQNMLSLERNGGHPDKMYVLEDMKDVNSPAFKRIEEQLQKYRLVENKHGNMLFTGKVKIEELQQLDQMQFKDMGLYITGLIAMQWSVPRSSIPYILGGTNTKDDTGGNSEKGYWENIKYAQELDAEVDNRQIWIPHFGVKLVYDLSYAQKDVQIETAKQLKLGNLVTENQLWQSVGKVLNPEILYRELARDVTMLQEAPEIEDPNTGLDKQLSKDTVNDSDDDRNVKDKKRDEQVQSINSRGMKPTGVGKEIQVKQLNYKIFLEGKQVMDADAQQIDLQTFAELYNEDKAYHPGTPPRVFMNRNDLFTTFKYKSSDFVYTTIVRNENWDENRVSIMNISGNIYEV